MIYLPPLRRLLVPVIILLVIIVFYRTSLRVPTSITSFVLHQPPPSPQGLRVSITDLKGHILPPVNASENHLSPPSQYFYTPYQESRLKGVSDVTKTSVWSLHVPNLDLEILWKCPMRQNKYTNHIRLPNIVQNISQIPSKSTKSESRIFWNPTIISLPYWSENQYLVVSRIVTDGNHQENVLCEANICYVGSKENATRGEKPCTEDDLHNVGPAGGMRCASAPTTLSVPPTPAENCEGEYLFYVDIPGFHDPRIFWSGRGEPLMMVNTQSRYACFGLWLIDLRTLHLPLSNLLSSSPNRPSLGPLKSYPALTELTRNPPTTRAAIEKNWMLFYPSSGESFIHYDISNPIDPSKGRTFAKVLGGGLTTENLTDSLELPCIQDLGSFEPEEIKKREWHQATNSLRLILCSRGDKHCKPTMSNTVFFAVVHRKHHNRLGLPLRYERYFIVWAATPPFAMLGISQHPLLMANETASGWSAAENWDGSPTGVENVDQTLQERDVDFMESYGVKDLWAHFTYTVSIAWAWGRDDGARDGEGIEMDGMNVGFLDDEVLLAIGVDDKGQAMARVKAKDLVQCLRACPEREEHGRQQDI